ncbi:Methyltransferase domain-containing protein [Natronincola peptidivorans]|uniref:Methyltransferase domain-containing protein n=1 Tax=Natronincola peptidivorans TaxID=426128 RepID=A0A1I0EDA8_9FIRM|nr:class I SAM-dependent methyltransferase [Natronincola peptidivorans]SET43045.1 Methyltransferase domain-containing protein [Natronincola peptidivorans]
MKNSTNISKYKRLAPVYDIIFGKFFIKGRKRAISMLNLNRDDKILMIGVGTGQDLNLLPFECFVTGIDISDAMLSKAKEKTRDRNVNLLNMNAERLEFEDESFDFAILNLVLSVVENPREVVCEALRVIKEDGEILIFDKFIENNSKVSILRKLLNKVTSIIGTDINRCFEDITDGLPICIIKDEPSMFNGNYRIILLKKS